MTPPVNGADLVSIADAAERHGVHPTTIRRWIRNGHLPAVRVGPRMLKIDPRELDQVTHPAGAIHVA